VTSPLYRDPRVYRGVLRLLYGGALAERERAVAALVPPGASVLDVCCGDGAIARRLPGRSYVGADASETFVRALARRGVDAVRLDAARDPLPRADVVLLLGSLYQFLPDADALVERLRRAARSHVVVAEPHRNLAQHPWRAVRALARRMTDPGVPSSTARFDEASLRALFARHGATQVVATPRELVAALPARPS
jgi:SAM-dependent methyltransferase